MSRRRNLGIHDPPHPSVRTLPEDARALYEQSFDEAMDVYHDKETAEATAWRTVRLKFRKAKRQWKRCSGRDCGWAAPMVLPPPKVDLVGLGVLVEYTFVDRNGELQRRNFRGHEPILWWDDKRKALYAFPRTSYTACLVRAKISRSALETYERWHQRQTECATEVSVPDVRVKPVGVADTVSYRSDKWHERSDDPRVRGAQEYIHHHWHDVWTFQDRDDARQRPEAIFIAGGALDLHERGLIH